MLHILSVDTSILSKIERSERTINEEQIAKIAIFFDLDPTQLYEEYLSEQVAKRVYLEINVNHILKVAKRKAEYLKVRYSKQGKIEF